MKRTIEGKVFVFGNNIDTDQIYPGRFVEYTNVEDVAQFAMNGADPDFVEKVKEGDVIVAGTNFGCGSSREHAAITLKAIGIGCVIAESFGRIFYRNAINLGLPVVVCPGIGDKVEEGEKITIDLIQDTIFKNENKIATIESMSGYVLEILENGGIKPMIKKQLQEKS